MVVSGRGIGAAAASGFPGVAERAPYRSPGIEAHGNSTGGGKERLLLTWSIIIRDQATGAFGVAVATKFFAVGSLCPHGAGGIGALATQALINPYYGIDGMALLSEGKAPSALISELIAADEGRDHRQLHAIGRAGPPAAYTGSNCIDWCGHRVGADLSVAGNMLAGPRVVEDSFAVMERRQDLSLAERLLAALQAGEAAGGDKRGRQSAALKIWGTELYPDLDLRVDDHHDPLVELRRLLDVAGQYFVHFRSFLPTRADPAGVFDRAQIMATIAERTRANTRSA
jgi:uncharacterized Ntn-hydrolase superfamily protein